MVVPQPPPPPQSFFMPPGGPGGVPFGAVPGMEMPRMPAIPPAAPLAPPQAAPAPPPPPLMGGGGGGGGVPVDDFDEGPASKRARGEDSLIPEAEFLARNPPMVNFKVIAPVGGDKPEWRLNGQLINLTLTLRETVTAIKAKIHEETGMPPSKQKLQMDSIFFKDSNTLAYYNISPGTVVNLQVKERGGRKK